MTPLEFTARQAAAILFNLARSTKPLTDAEKLTCHQIQEQLDILLRNK